MKNLLFIFCLVPYIFCISACKKANNDEDVSAREIFAQNDIRSLTDAKTISQYIIQNHRLPNYYITKTEARKLGWNPAAGNLCNILPGRAIGGDAFRNRERNLPVRGKYYEADVNYNCGTRGPDRLIFDQTGNVWLTRDHYKTFKKL